jgi:hypothetical protein
MESPWVGNYFGPVPIRCRGGLHFYSARDAARRLRVVVMAPRLPPEEARGRLAGLARVHRLVEGEHVPGVVDESLEGPLPWVALDCDAVADFETLTDFVRQGAEPPPFELSSAVGKTIMETLCRGSRTRDPDSLEPICLGSLSPGNLLFGADGRMWLVGFGAGPLAGAVVAPEVAAGARERRSRSKSCSRQAGRANSRWPRRRATGSG